MSGYRYHQTWGGVLLTLAVLVLALMAIRSTSQPARAVGSSVRVLRVFSAGRGLSPALLGGKPQHDAIVLAESVLTTPSSEEGLRAAIFDPSDMLLSYRIFAIGNESVNSLEQFVQGVPEGGCAAFAVSGALASDVEVAAQLVKLFSSLGARQPPRDSAPVSWAFVACRQRGEWQAVAEARSGAHGVSVAALLGSTVGDETPLLADHSRRRRLVEMLEVSTNEQGCYVEYGRIANGNVVDSIVASPPHGEQLAKFAHGTNRVSWRRLTLGSRPEFRSFVSIQEGARTLSDGVIFEVFVNGEVVAAYPYGVGRREVMGWQPFTVDLTSYAGQTVDFELVVAPCKHPMYDWAAWGDPAIVDVVDEASDDARRSVTGGARGDASQRACVVFFAHTYPLNGFDKRDYDLYLGWDTSDFTRAQSLRKRLAVDRDAMVRSAFYAHAASVQPTRVIWGGDNAYANLAGEAAAVATLTRFLPMARHVVLPGNHDPAIAFSDEIKSLDAIPPGSEETLAGVRLLYLDSVNEGQRPMYTVDDPSMLRMGWSHWESRPTRQWIDAFKEKLTSSNEQAVVLFLHHAPWLTEQGTANIAHPANSWWIQEIHPMLADLAKNGKSVTVLGGDAGDNTLCDARSIDGVRYAVCGLPRFDSAVPYGFITLEWTQNDPSPKATLHASPLTEIAPPAAHFGETLTSDSASQFLPFATQNLEPLWESVVIRAK